MTHNKDKPYNDLPLLPPEMEVETKPVLKQAITASRALAELKKKGHMLPKQEVLINSLVLLEAKDSSEIESIFTTHDKMYQADVLKEQDVDLHTKEVSLYRQALWNGVSSIKSRPLSTNTFIEIYRVIKRTSASVRTVPGTQIVNPSGKLIYTPPEGETVLRNLLKNLEDFIHADNDIDPLIKMAIMHYQFEAIHPFTDGNGRTGRILNILYLLSAGLLETPVLFLSRYIIQNKTPYYQGLQNVTENQDWQGWILYMLEAVEHTAYNTMRRIEHIEDTMKNFAEQLKEKDHKLYSKDLIELLFEQPYCRIQTVADRLGVNRQTASGRLQKLVEIDLMDSFKDGREVVYVNPSFFNALKNDGISNA